MVKTTSKKAELAEGDPLQLLLKLLGFNILRDHGYIAKSLYFSAVLYVEMFNIMFAVEVFRNGSWSYFVEYSPLVFLLQPGCIGLLIVCRHDYKTFEFIEKLSDLPPISSVGRELNNRIQLCCKIAKGLCILFCFFSLLAIIITFVPVSGSDSSINFTAMFCNDHFGKWSVIFRGIHYAYILCIWYGTAVVVGVSVYMVFELKIQLILLKQRLKQISLECACENQRKHQNLIYQRIKACVNNHITILKAAEVMGEVALTPILTLPLSGVCFYVAAFYFLTFKVNPENNITVMFAGISGLLMLIILCFCGQLLTDESENLFRALTNLPWLDWNTENRKALLVFLMNSSKPLRLTGIGIININYAFLLSMVKMSYSLLTLFKHFEH